MNKMINCFVLLVSMMARCAIAGDGSKPLLRHDDTKHESLEDAYRILALAYDQLAGRIDKQYNYFEELHGHHREKARKIKAEREAVAEERKMQWGKALSWDKANVLMHVDRNNPPAVLPEPDNRGSQADNKPRPSNKKYILAAACGGIVLGGMIGYTLGLPHAPALMPLQR